MSEQAQLPSVEERQAFAQKLDREVDLPTIRGHHPAKPEQPIEVVPQRHAGQGVPFEPQRHPRVRIGELPRRSREGLVRIAVLANLGAVDP